MPLCWACRWSSRLLSLWQQQSTSAGNLAWS
jgi:hypothetical protein